MVGLCIILFWGVLILLVGSKPFVDAISQELRVTFWMYSVLKFCYIIKTFVFKK